MQAEHSLVLASVTRLLSPALLVVAVWLLGAGHDQPGGGFVAGLLAGAGIALARLAGQRWRLATLPSRALIGGGLTIAAGVALAPLLLGLPPVDMGRVSLELPVAGTVKLTSALVFDVGVALVVLGLVVATLEAFLDGPSPSRAATAPNLPDRTEEV